MSICLLDIFNQQMLEKLYVFSSYLYYVESTSIMSDNMFEGICTTLRGKKTIYDKRITKANLRAGTGYSIKLTKKELKELETYKRQGIKEFIGFRQF